MNQSRPEEKKENSEVSLKDLILKIGALTRYLKSKWIIIISFSILGSCLGVLYSIIKKPVYTAVSTFVLDEGGKSGAGLSQYASLASLAGIDVNNGGGIFQGDNIIELYKSRTMIEKTLLSEVEFNGKSQKLIDRYIAGNELRTKWKDKPYQNVTFNNSPDSFTRAQDSIITDIVKTFNLSLLNVVRPDKKLNIIQVLFSSKDELFSKEFTNQLVNNVNTFYTFTKTKKSLQNVSILQRQSDSVRLILNSSINGVASAIDAAPNANPNQVVLRVPAQKRQVDVQANTAIYSEMVKNLEIAKISLRQETPLIQVIDKPVLPLAMDRVGKLKGILIGFIAGFFLTAIFLTIKKASRTLIN